MNAPTNDEILPLPPFTQLMVDNPNKAPPTLAPKNPEHMFPTPNFIFVNEINNYKILKLNSLIYNRNFINAEKEPYGPYSTPIFDEVKFRT